MRIQRAADDTTHGGGGWWSVDDGATGTSPSSGSARYEFNAHPLGQPGVKRPRKRRNQIPSADAAQQDEAQVFPLDHFTFPEHASPHSYPQVTPHPHLGASCERRHRPWSYAAPTAGRVNPYPAHDRNYHSPVLPRRVCSPGQKPFPPLCPVDRGHPQSRTLYGNQNPSRPCSSLELPPLQLPLLDRSRPNPMRISSLVHDGQSSGPAAPTRPN